MKKSDKFNTLELCLLQGEFTLVGLTVSNNINLHMHSRTVHTVRSFQFTLLNSAVMIVMSLKLKSDQSQISTSLQSLGILVNVRFYHMSPQPTLYNLSLKLLI